MPAPNTVGAVRTVTDNELANLLGALPCAEPRVVASGNVATPTRVLAILDATVEAYRLFMLNAHGDLPTRVDVIHETPFVGPAMRHSPGLDYLPTRLSLVPKLFATSRPPDVVVVHTSPPVGGRVSLGIEVNILPAALEQARANGGIVVAQVNRQMPYTFGDGELDLDQIDVALEVDEPLPSIQRHTADERTEMISEHASTLVGDGATLQLGIGQVPDAVLRRVVDRRSLRIWSEVASDGILDLERAGALEATEALTVSFLLGSSELYAWADRNERLRVRRTETVNDPSRIASNPAMTSINAALQVDLFAQANASYVAGRIYSGFGGQPDFVVGALHSAGGHAVIALPGWHDKSDRSTIVPMIDVPAASFQHSAVVTEHGCAHLFGRSQRAQTRALIEEAADQRAHDELWAAAEARGLGAR